MQVGRLEYKHGKSAPFKVKIKWGEDVQEQTSQGKEETGFFFFQRQWLSLKRGPPAAVGKMSLSSYIPLCCVQCFSDYLGDQVIHAHGAKMCLLKIKMQEKRNEVNNTSSSGSAGGATLMMAIKHTSSARYARSWGLLHHHSRLRAGEEEAAAQRGNLPT